MMLTPEYLRQHIDALLHLSDGVHDPVVSAKIAEMADELRIMVSVAAITGLAADIKTIDLPSLPRPAEVVPFKRQDRPPARQRGRSR
jgi:hypothetical protein